MKDAEKVAKMAPTEPPQMQQMQAMVIPIPLFAQMVELIRGHACHRDADPVMQQVSQLTPQTVNFNPMQ